MIEGVGWEIEQISYMWKCHNGDTWRRITPTQINIYSHIEERERKIIDRIGRQEVELNTWLRCCHKCADELLQYIHTHTYYIMSKVEMCHIHTPIESECG